MDSSKSSPRVLYVGGDVRSGTTIVDMLLGMNTGSIAVGEVNLFFRQVEKTVNPVKCSCGKTLQECPLWSEVLVRFRAALPGISLQQADLITRKIETFPRHYGDARHYWDAYAEIWHTMFTAIAEVSGASCMIDSSKTGQHSLRRPLRLAEAGFEVELLHIVRDPRAVTWSKLRREIDKGRLKGNAAIFAAALMSGLHWSITNADTHWFYHSGKALPYDEVRYEDFVEHPVETLQTAEKLLHIDLSRSIDVVRTDEPIQSGHLASGNEIRMQAPLLVRKQPPTWKSALPKSARLAALVSSPVAHFYHYNLVDYG